MEKKRIAPPHDRFWIDNDGMIHVCQYLHCENGCSCEGSVFDLFSLLDATYFLRKALTIKDNKEFLRKGEDNGE